MKKIYLALLIAAAAVSAHAHADCYSDGIRIGSIQKFSQKGFVNKSWEGELVMEGAKLRTTPAGGLSGGNVWRFSVVDPVVAKSIDEVTMSGGQVALRYCQQSPLDLTRAFATETSYWVTQAVARK